MLYAFGVINKKTLILNDFIYLFFVFLVVIKTQKNLLK